MSERPVREWLARWRTGSEPALNDRGSAPARRRRLPSEQVAAIATLRPQQLTSPVIARRLDLPLSTVGAVLRRLGLGRLQRFDPPAPVVRSQRERPGELVHIDIKKLGKIAGLGHRITGRRSGMVNRHRGIRLGIPQYAGQPQPSHREPVEVDRGRLRSANLPLAISFAGRRRGDAARVAGLTAASVRL